MAKSGAAQAAAQSGQSYNEWSKGMLPASGYAGPSIGGVPLTAVPEDAMAMLASRLAQLNSYATENSTRMGGFGSHARDEAAALEQVYNKMMGKRDPLIDKPAPRQARASVAGGGGGSGMGGPGGRGGYGGGRGGFAGYGGEPPMMPAILDPYQKVREDAIKAAQSYLRMKNPHLISSMRG